MRGRGQEGGLRAEGGLYNSRSCHRPTSVLKQFEAVACTSELFKAFAHTIDHAHCGNKRWKKNQTYHIADRNMRGNSRKQGRADKKRRLDGAWMTARDATLVIVQADRGIYMASLVLSPLMAPCSCAFKYVRAPIGCGAILQCCLM